MFRRLRANPIAAHYLQLHSSTSHVRQWVGIVLLLIAIVAVQIVPVGVVVLAGLLLLSPLIVAARTALYVSAETHREDYALLRVSGLSGMDIANGLIYTAYLRSRVWFWLPLTTPLFAAPRVLPLIDLSVEPYFLLVLVMLIPLYISASSHVALALMLGFGLGHRIKDGVLAAVLAVLIMLISFAVMGGLYFLALNLRAGFVPVALVGIVIFFPFVLAYVLLRLSHRWV